ncbi:MAG: hypothetical protein WBP12_04715 [Candidatus Saccharimonas sp.]
MDIQPQSTQPISDDQELAKVLAGVNAEADVAEESAPTPPTPPATPVVSNPSDNMVYMPPIPAPTSAPAVDGDLASVKQDAIVELRPLVDKLNLVPEEKFDTLLLLIRSTDDKALIGPAHEAAKAITDETKKAQALLDIIKEIDFLSGQAPAA